MEDQGFAEGSGTPYLVARLAERLGDYRRERHTVALGIALPRERKLTRQADRLCRVGGAVVARRVGEPCRLSEEGVGAGEALRRKGEHQHARAPAGLAIGAAVAGKALRQRLDEKGEAEALVAMVEAADRQDRAAVLECPRIVGGCAVAVEEPLLRKLAARGAKPSGHPGGGDRHRHVDQHRVGLGGNSGGDRVRSDQRVEAAIGGDVGGARVGGEDEDEISGPRRRFEKGGEAGDVVTAADGDGADAVARGARHGVVDGEHRRPHARETAGIPGDRGAGVGEHLGPAVLGHAAVLDRRDIVGEEREAVGGVAVEIPLDQAAGNGFRRLGGKAGAL